MQIVTKVRKRAGPSKKSGGQSRRQSTEQFGEQLRQQPSAEGPVERNVPAHVDALTGMPNRTGFFSLVDLDRSGNAGALILFNLNGFALINNALGLGCGDELLCQVAKRLESLGPSIARGRRFARLAADEFAWWLPRTGPQAAVALAKVALGRICGPFRIGGRELGVGARAGIALYPNHGQSLALMLSNAGIALHQAADSVRAGDGAGHALCLYHPDFGLRARRDLNLENGLRSALSRASSLEGEPAPGRAEELSLHYQPIVDAHTGDLRAMEALIRWRHPDFGPVAACTAVSLAERGILIHQLGDWVLRQACAQCQAWAATIPAMRVSVNISAREFYDSDLVSRVRTVLAETGLNPRRLLLEITEYSAIARWDQAVARIRDLRGIGVGIMIDDFGSGYSSLGCLNRLPVNAVKLDRSFMDQDNPASPVIIRSVMDMAKGLGLAVVAEGVEHPAQLHHLRELGCPAVQGYAIARPASVSDLEARLRGPRPRFALD